MSICGTLYGATGVNMSRCLPLSPEATMPPASSHTGALSTNLSKPFFNSSAKPLQLMESTRANCCVNALFRKSLRHEPLCEVRCQSMPAHPFTLLPFFLLFSFFFLFFFLLFFSFFFSFFFPFSFFIPFFFSPFLPFFLFPFFPFFLFFLFYPFSLFPLFTPFYPFYLFTF